MLLKIFSAPEFFQLKMLEILDDLEGVVCLMDDILIHDKDIMEHNERLKHMF